MMKILLTFFPSFPRYPFPVQEFPMYKPADIDGLNYEGCMKENGLWIFGGNIIQAYIFYAFRLFYEHFFEQLLTL